MTASEIIDQIKALPPEEQARVVDYVRQLPADQPLSQQQIRYADPEEVKTAGDRIFDRYDELFRKLAQ